MGEVTGEDRPVLPSHPTHLARSALGKNKGADLLGWVGVTLLRAGEIFITAPIRPTNFAPRFTMHQKPHVVTGRVTSGIVATMFQPDSHPEPSRVVT